MLEKDPTFPSSPKCLKEPAQDMLLGDTAPTELGEKVRPSRASIESIVDWSEGKLGRAAAGSAPGGMRILCGQL